MANGNNVSDILARPGCVKLRILLLLLALIAPPLQAEAPQDGDPRICAVPSASIWSPPKTATEPVRIGVEFFLLDLKEINDKSNSFTIDFVMTPKGGPKESVDQDSARLWLQSLRFKPQINETTFYEGSNIPA